MSMENENRSGDKRGSEESDVDGEEHGSKRVMSMGKSMLRNGAYWNGKWFSPQSLH